MADPPLHAGYARIAVLLDAPAGLTPGAIARATGLAPEAIGGIRLDGDQALVDVRADAVETARRHLDAVGATQLQGRGAGATRDEAWGWLRIAVGRNHGLTARQLRRRFTDLGFPRLGRYRVQNAFSLLGLPEADLERALETLAEGEINGVPLRPRRENRRQDPRFDPERSPARRR